MPRHKFTGKERDDTESGLDEFGARYYASSMGRNMSIDPAFESEILELPQTWNRYSYVYNRPLFATDPDGRCRPCVGAIIGGVVEGGWNLGSQLYNNGGSPGDVNWRDVGANALGGAVTGAIAGVTGGTSLLAEAVVGAGANAAGGIVTRIAEGEGPDEAFDTEDIASDAVSGFVGGAAGHLASEFVHPPEGEMGPRPKGCRHAAKYDAELKQREPSLESHISSWFSPPIHGICDPEEMLQEPEGDFLMLRQDPPATTCHEVAYLSGKLLLFLASKVLGRFGHPCQHLIIGGQHFMLACIVSGP